MFYHIWFVTKYRKAVLDRKTKERLLEIIEEIVGRKNYRILEADANKDHMHILLEAARKEDVPGIVRTMKAVTAKKILEETPHLRVGNIRHLWARRYGCKEVKADAVANVREYIRSQERIPHA
jgi:putative transposase